jgi:hypothetical protein
MPAVRTFIGLANELDTPPAPSLAESVRAVRRDHGSGRWQLHLTREHVELVAYALWLEVRGQLPALSLGQNQQVTAGCWLRDGVSQLDQQARDRSVHDRLHVVARRP